MDNINKLHKVAKQITHRSDTNNCFIIMSFSGNPIIESYYSLAVKPIIEKNNLVPIRIDEQVFTGNITDEIKVNIQNAKLIIADLTEDKANCYFELGYALALGKDFIIQRLNAPGYQVKFEFDIKDYPHILYTTIEDLRLKLDKSVLGILNNRM